VESSFVQFSLKLILAGFVLLGIFLALVRISDLMSATIFMFMVIWLLSPLLMTFAVLYWQLKGGRRRTR